MSIVITAIVAGTLGLVIGCVLASSRCNDCREVVDALERKEKSHVGIG